MQQNLEQLKPAVDFNAVKSFIESFTVSTADQYLLASNELITLKKKRNDVVASFAEMKNSAYATWKAIVAREKFFTDQIDAFEYTLKRKMLTFQAEQNRIKMQKQLQLQAEAEARVAAERQKLLAQAAEAAVAGDTLEVDMYVEAAASVEAAPIVLAPAVPKAAGISTREVWRAQIVDKQAFVAAAAADPKLAKYIVIDVNTMVKQGWRECAGIKFYTEQVLYARS